MNDDASIIFGDKDLSDTKRNIKEDCISDIRVTTCKYCGGSGMIHTEVCENCDGIGIIVG